MSSSPSTDCPRLQIITIIDTICATTPIFLIMDHQHSIESIEEMLGISCSLHHLTPNLELEINFISFLHLSR